MFKFTKIGATIGPACEDPVMLEKMVKAGLNFARLNFAHGTYEWYEKTIKNLRQLSIDTKEPLPILQDLQGPRIRIGAMPDKGIEIKAGATVSLDTAVNVFVDKDLPVDHPDLHRFVNVGERVLIDDGRIEIKIDNVTGTKITGTVVQGGFVMSHKGINLPDSLLGIPALSDKDRDDLRFGVKNGVDFVGLSFVSTAKDILDVRYLIKEYEKELNIERPYPIRIIAKIERHEAIKNIESIIETADGIMVARGDLGLELPADEVPIIQKRIIDLARQHAKPVIVATQLLDSMRESLRPTRAEVSDVANAVIDHTDAMLLTNETAAGKHPVEVVKMMNEIITSTEASHYDDVALVFSQKLKNISSEEAITELSRFLAEEVKAKMIVAASLTGETGRLLSHVRPKLPIMVATNNETVYRQLGLSWGVDPFILPNCRSVEELIERAIEYFKETKRGKKGDKMIVVGGEPFGQAGNVNLVEVREIK